MLLKPLKQGFVVTFAVALCVAASGFASVASAATITVDSLADVMADDAQCTLRDAIASSDADAPLYDCNGVGNYGADTIQLMPGTYDISGGGELTIQSDITVVGDLSNAQNMVIDGVNMTRIVKVLPGGVANLQGLSLMNGYSNLSGAGIFNDGSLTLDTVVIQGNKTDDDGGGVYNSKTGHILAINNSNIDGNTCNLDQNVGPNPTDYDAGGGLYNEGAIDAIDNTTFNSNTATGMGTVGGGFVNFTGAVVTSITNSHFDQNTAEVVGGLANYESDILLLKDSTISHNIANWTVGIYSVSLPGETPANLSANNVTIDGNFSNDPQGGSGSGVYVYGPGTATFDNSFITNNVSALNGGGFYNAGGGGTLKITNTQINSNTANSDGGGIYNGQSDAILTLDNVTLDGNKTTHHGGALSNVGTVDIMNSVITNNVAQNGAGGGIINRLGLMNITNTTISNNSSSGEEGGGLYNMQAIANLDTVTMDHNATDTKGGAIYNNKTLTIKNSNIFKNTAALDGGGIYNNNQGIISSIIDSTIDNNIADSDNNMSGSGGGIYNLNQINDINNTVISSNGAILGGGVWNGLNGNINFSNQSSIDTNTATVGGGGLYNDDGTTMIITMTDTSMKGNMAPKGSGGAIMNKGVLTIKLANFSGNTAFSHGGAIWNGRTITGISNATFDGNVADDLDPNTVEFGGAIVTTTPTGTMGNIDDSIFTNNRATYGGALYNNSVTKPIINNSTFDSNTATFLGGAIFASYADLDINNSTISNNTALHGGGMYNWNGNNNITNFMTTITNSTISDNTAVQSGGGIYTSGNLTLINDTIVNNASDINNDGFDFGGGLSIENGAAYAATLAMRNNIVTDNTRGSGASLINDDCTALNQLMIASKGSNMVGGYSKCAGWVSNGAAGDDILISVLGIPSGVDLNLLDNGGKT